MYIIYLRVPSGDMGWLSRSKTPNSSCSGRDNSQSASNGNVPDSLILGKASKRKDGIIDNTVKQQRLLMRGGTNPNNTYIKYNSTPRDQAVIYGIHVCVWMT